MIITNIRVRSAIVVLEPITNTKYAELDAHTTKCYLEQCTTQIQWNSPLESIGAISRIPHYLKKC